MQGRRRASSLAVGIEATQVDGAGESSEGNTAEFAMFRARGRSIDQGFQVPPLGVPTMTSVNGGNC